MNKELLLIAKLKREAAAATAAQLLRDSLVVEAVEAKAERGLTGPAGADGLDGLIGPAGTAGLDGTDGKDAVAVTDVDFDFDNRLVMTMEDGSVHVSESSVNIMRGQTGAQGATGPQGPAGADGTGGGSGNLDGGRADSVYTAVQLIQGGGA